MEKERRIKALAIVVLVIAVLGLTIAFAALSQTLTINGSANVDAATWDIHFENIQLKEKVGSATANVPNLTGTSITDIEVSLIKPGDKIVYEFDIVNNGDIDAKLDNITYNKFEDFYKKLAICIGTTKTECMKYDYDNDGHVTISDYFAFQRNFNAALYENDELIEQYDYDPDENTEYGFQIAAHTTRHIKLIIGFKETADFVLDEPVTIFDSNKTAIQMDFVQK